MNPRRLIFVFVSILLVLGVAKLPRINSAQEAGPKAEWTLMMYMDADNDLESDQMEDLKEMLAAGSSENVNIVVLADRHPAGDGRKFTNEPIANLKNWTSAKLLYVKHNELEELADWGEVNMGDPATLKKFLQTATKAYPAKKYGIIFEDHGTGWPGACADDTNGGDMLTNEEIAASLKEATSSAGKFELIGFDACLMGNLEVAKAMAPYGHALVASEELEPGSGWNFTPTLQTLNKSPQMSGMELGHVIVDAYNDYFTKSDDEDTRDEGLGITLGLIALDQLGPLEKAVDDFSAQNQAALTKIGRPSFLKIADARSHAEEYGKSGEENGMSDYDLLDLAQHIKQQPPSPDAAKAADAVIQAIKNVVVYSIHGKARPNSHGLSIFFPADKDDLTSSYGKAEYPRTAFSQSTKWLPFLASYTGVDAQDLQAPELEKVETTKPDVQSGDIATVTAQIKADDIDEATFVLASLHDKEEVIIGSLPVDPDDKGVLKESWDGEWFTIGDEQTELICPITDFEELDEKEDTYIAEVPAQARFKGETDWFDVSLYFYLDFNEQNEDVTGEFIYAFEDTKYGPRQIELEAGDDVRPMYLVIDDKGKDHYRPADGKDQVLHLRSEQDLKVGRQKVPKGNYEVGFVVKDFAGNTSEKFTPVKVE
jgi:clostripain